MAKDMSPWLAGALRKHGEVQRATRFDRNLVCVDRKNKPPVMVGVISASPVPLADVEPFLSGGPRPAMIVNVPTRAPWTGEAMDRLEAEGVAFGKMYDLFRGLGRDEELSEYKNPEHFYVERLFRQHRRIIQWERVSDRSYKVIRDDGAEFVIALTDDYEVTADGVRRDYDNLAPFDFLFKTNPYGRISASALDAAKQLNVQVLDSEQIYGALSE